MVKTEVTCPQCGKVCKNEPGLKIHMYTHKREKTSDDIVEKVKKVKGVEAALRRQNKTLKMLAMMAIQELAASEL